MDSTNEENLDGLLSNLDDIIRAIRHNSQDAIVRKVQKHDSVRKMSIFDEVWVHASLIQDVVTKIHHCHEDIPPLRAMGALCGLCVADSIGHNFEFLPIQDSVDSEGSYLEYPSTTPGGIIHNPKNQFMLRPGQWTDDASMSLSMADSLLSCGLLNGSNLRCWFWNWWNNGVDNAFKYDESRSQSVGLGGNISSSLFDVTRLACGNRPIPHKFHARSEDAGNGSLMRLAPVAIRYHHSIALARRAALESSYSTHPGHTAAEACSFLAHVLVRAIHRDANGEDQEQVSKCRNAQEGLEEPPIRRFIDTCVGEYLTLLSDAPSEKSQEDAKQLLRRLLIGEEPIDGTEACWNWRASALPLQQTVRSRGLWYVIREL